MSAIVFVTAEKPVRVSLAFLAGVIIATTAGVAASAWLAGLLGDAISLGEPSQTRSVGKLIQIALVGLLAAAAVKNCVGRETVEPPGWLGALQSASAMRALTTGLVVILAMPSDILIMLAVGVNLAQNDAALTSAVPFIVATVFIAALPLLAFLVFHRRANEPCPRSGTG
jgi:threonine/homoserine/homoserine lactone efflux protein